MIMDKKYAVLLQYDYVRTHCFLDTKSVCLCLKHMYTKESFLYFNYV